MKTKALYTVIFILAVIIIFALIYSKKKIAEINPPVAVSGEIQAQTRQQPGAITTQSVEPVFFHKQAVTIVKPAQKKKEVAVDKTQDLSSPIASSSLANGSGVGDTKEVTAGVTKLGKYPTKEEVKEMNSKGIIIY
jgi:hypothetical protein